jgi:hypothetical protein
MQPQNDDVQQQYKEKEFLKNFRNATNYFFIFDCPKVLTKTIRSYKIETGSFLTISETILFNSSCDGLTQKNRFNIGIGNPNVLHAVFFLVAARQFMFLIFPFK